MFATAKDGTRVPITAVIEPLVEIAVRTVGHRHVMRPSGAQGDLRLSRVEPPDDAVEGDEIQRWESAEARFIRFLRAIP